MTWPITGHRTALAQSNVCAKAMQIVDGYGYLFRQESLVGAQVVLHDGVRFRALDPLGRGR